MNPVLKSNFDSSTITISQSPFTVGRAIDNTHVITNVSISRHHCSFTKSDDNKWRLKDTSSNGTQVNGKLLKNCESEELKNGDVIVLSATTGYSYIFEDTTNPIIVLDDSDIIKLEPTQSDERLCDVVDSLMEVVVESAPINNSNEQSNAQPSPNPFESTEDELTCAICSELFIKTVTLQCSHSFCKYCVEMWKKNKPNCPICRTRIVTITPTLTIDNLINKLLDNLPQDRKEQRNKTIEQRQTVDKPTTSSEVVISSEEELEEDSMEDSFDDDDMDEDYDYESHYYGGYGRCYSCGRRGHWANRCPYRYS